MSNCSEHKNPLHHNGTSQAQRLLPGLDKTKFALADEKGYAAWILFANEFAAFLNFYGADNLVAGNWQPFFSADISAQLGTIAIQNIDSYRYEIKERFDFIKNDDNKTFLTEIHLRFNELFSALFTLSKALDRFAFKLPEETQLKNTIRNSVSTKLAPVLNRLIAYQKAAEGLGYLTHAPLTNWKILNTQLTDELQIIDADGLSELWFDQSLFTDWTNYKNSILEDQSIFNNPLTAFGDEYLSISHAVNHNLFSGIFDTYLAAYTKIIKEAGDALLKTLENYDAHTPHYTLFLAFLKLFRFAQTHINTITQRHLDFYYKEVLRLQPKAAQANKAHILGELAKHVDSFLLAKGTGLKAGKDSLNKEVIYTLDNDAVFNKAKITQLKTFYKAVAADTIYIAGTVIKKQENNGRIFSSSVTNSEDGMGAALTGDNKEWQPYVHKVYKEAALESIAMPKARIGFALASHYLYLTEGERKVFIRLVLNSNAALNGKNITCYLTTEKEWYQVDSTVIASAGKKLSDGISNCAEIVFVIPGSAPAIVNYNAAAHGGSFNVAVPVLKVYLDNDDNTLYEYDLLKNITVAKAEIRVEVGMENTYSQKGLKNIFLSNDFGELDPAKPFQAFGAQPIQGNRLVIGSREIFTKKHTALNLNIEWKGLPSSSTDISFVALSDGGNFPNISKNILEAGVWKNLNANDEIFENQGSGVKATRLIHLPVDSINNSVVGYSESYPLYNISSNRGFIALQLTQSFGHKEYLQTLTDYLILKANNNAGDDISKPREPYIPTIQSFYAGYSAYCISNLSDASENNFNNREIKFFQVFPFGEAEQHKYLTPSSGIHLLPQFNHSGEGVTVPHTGEFYIGIEKLHPGDAVNILFQVMEGTTNPTVTKPAEHIHWSYLSNNQWVAFAKNSYSDNTLALVQSGIISFAIPKNASLTNSMLPAGYIWIRAAIREAAEAVCKLISVDAQAALASFSDNDNAADFLDSALPADVISKLKNPEAAIKKITQPYPSFGGRPKENEGHFYMRVSERLRHKARAITIWDYEHILLEAFPEIYKVKCLNHTQIEPGIYNEVKPGYVSIITIPSLQNRNDANPLKPFTQQSTLTKIENFLRPRISCFVNLHACQPQFEEIRLEFSLKLYEQYKDFTFYANRLKVEITQFLSPWAFGSSSTIDFGGKIYKSVLINFIEERYYVDFIVDVSMYVKVDEVNNESADMDEIIASTARSILVSVPAPKHVIHEITISDEDVTEICPVIEPLSFDKNIN